MVNKERLDILLQEVIQEARALKIPVSSTIEKNVIVNGRPKKRFGCCRKSRNGFEIEVSRFLSVSYTHLNRLAAKVVKTKKYVRLEPMNPYERKIIHATLQKNPNIITRSEGEEPYRRVIIELKK